MAGPRNTLTRMVAVEVQPAGEYAVRVYRVSCVMLATGSAMSGSVRPSDGAHVYRTPPLAFNCKGYPCATTVSSPAYACEACMESTCEMVSEGQPWGLSAQRRIKWRP